MSLTDHMLQVYPTVVAAAARAPDTEESSPGSSSEEIERRFIDPGAAALQRITVATLAQGGSPRCSLALRDGLISW